MRERTSYVAAVRERTSYVVAATFRIVGRDGSGVDARNPLPQCLFVGRFRDEHQAEDHRLRVRSALEDIPWLTDVQVTRETVWHLRSGRAAAQLVRDIYGHSPWVEPSRDRTVA